MCDFLARARSWGLVRVDSRSSTLGRDDMDDDNEDKEGRREEERARRVFGVLERMMVLRYADAVAEVQVQAEAELEGSTVWMLPAAAGAVANTNMNTITTVNSLLIPLSPYSFMSNNSNTNSGSSGTSMMTSCLGNVIVRRPPVVALFGLNNHANMTTTRWQAKIGLLKRDNNCSHKD